MGKKFVLSLIILFSLAFASAIPQTINVHGKLNNSSGALTYPIDGKIFKLGFPVDFEMSPSDPFGSLDDFFLGVIYG